MVNITFVPREDWNAMPPKFTEPLTHPIENVHFSICNLTDPCRTADECNYRVKEIQNIQCDVGLSDIAFNFIIGNDGNVYVGRGWHSKPGAEVRVKQGLDDKTIDIGVICGHKETNEESSEMIALAFRKANELVRWGVENKFIVEDFKKHGFPEEIIDIDVSDLHAKNLEPIDVAKLEDHEKAVASGLDVL